MSPAILDHLPVSEHMRFEMFRGIDPNPPAIIKETKTLTELCHEFKIKCDSIVRRERMNLESAFELGDVIQKIKKQCKQGELEEVIKKFTGIEYTRKYERYVQLAKNRGLIEEHEYDNGEQFTSVRDALEFLWARNRKPTEESNQKRPADAFDVNDDQPEPPAPAPQPQPTEMPPERIESPPTQMKLEPPSQGQNEEPKNITEPSACELTKKQADKERRKNAPPAQTKLDIMVGAYEKEAEAFRQSLPHDITRERFDKVKDHALKIIDYARREQT